MANLTRLRFDPHVHTGASYDAAGSVEAVLARCQERHLDAVAITDHDTTAAARRAAALGERYGILVVPGVEISTADGHLLAVGVTAEPPTGHAFASAVEWVRARGRLAVVPHPFQRSRHGVDRQSLGDCDGIEVFNAWAVTGLQNRRAAALARRRGYPELGGSDAHRPGRVGTAYTEVHAADATVEGVLDAIADGRCRAVGDSLPFRSCVRKYTGALARRLRPGGGRTLPRRFRRT
jgi:predicted metal-dependent phosphoesterase TrpH